MVVHVWGRLGVVTLLGVERVWGSVAVAGVGLGGYLLGVERVWGSVGMSGGWGGYPVGGREGVG